MLSEDLHLFMLHFKVILDSCNIYLAADNQNNETLHVCQCHWIAKIIHYTHYAAVKKLFNHDSAAERINLSVWSELLIIEQLVFCCTFHYDLDSILENESTISNTYSVIDAVFMKQLRYDHEKNFDEWLHLVYDDQKTVSLICAVQKK